MCRRALHAPLRWLYLLGLYLPCSLCVGALFVPLFEAWAEGTLVPTMARHRDTIATIANGVELTVTLFALYALFMTYRLAKVRHRCDPSTTCSLQLYLL